MEGEVVNFTDPVICSTAHKAVKAFEKKFKDETKNNWADRDNFVTKKGKYTMIELDRRTEVRVDEVDGTIRTVLPVNLDIEQMPLGKLSEKQIDKGFKVLEDIERKLKETEEKLKELSSSFYSTIPHNFGDNPPPIPNQEDIEQKKGSVENYKEAVHYSSANDAVKAFEKMFKDKTENNWAERDNFVTKKEKYTLIELDWKVDEVDGITKTVLPVNPDIEKMPLGNLSEKQIKKGFEELEKIKAALELKVTLAELEVLSSSFYSTIPHDFGQSQPPVINTQEVIDQEELMATMLMVISLMIKLEEYEDYDCTLTQTNIKDNNNNNKFYVIQVVKINNGYYCLWKWGRVMKGEDGIRRESAGYISANDAIKEFEKKFKQKTKNNWADRDNFVTHKGKYTLIELDRRTEVDEVDGTTKTVLQVNPDIEKMPLGKLSEKQIDKGVKVLKEIEDALGQTLEELEELSSRFYTTIPHNYSRKTVPPVINTQEVINQKKTFLETLRQPEAETETESESESESEAEAEPEAEPEQGESN
ncbi:hypothetical protein NHX12_029935 [Muraenolepis orangiensis]|uniref:Poly [ADP-ribose] polymerase n=1 Tax=Muraenolepis orangiensis TaxID=630683 RepID=A0A9Q0EAA8_9TELE|nr:hypothetical protein NHX12_029935 [Muraenolepis orangiensis]